MGNAATKGVICLYGLLKQLFSEHVFKQPIPLNTEIRALDALCDILTGHSTLQLFQFQIELSYAQFHTCATEESLSHTTYFGAKTMIANSCDKHTRQQMTGSQ